MLHSRQLVANRMNTVRIAGPETLYMEIKASSTAGTLYKKVLKYIYTYGIVKHPHVGFKLHVSLPPFGISGSRLLFGFLSFRQCLIATFSTKSDRTASSGSELVHSLGHFRLPLLGFVGNDNQVLNTDRHHPHL